ncbi:MAG: cation:proton antiporter [Pseudomonadota bacterium]
MNLVIFIAVAGLLTFLVHALLRDRVPVTPIAVIVGFAASELATGVGLDLGLRWETFADLIVLGALPVLIFEAAMLYDDRAAKARAGAILLIVGPALLLAIAVGAAVMFALMDRPDIFNWQAALYTGVLLAAIDPLAAIRLLRRFPECAGSGQLLASEGLLNDAIAVVLASIVISTAGLATPAAAGQAMLWLVAGGVGVGAIVAGVTVLAARQQPAYERVVVLTLFAAYASFAVAEALEVSGATSALVCGLLVRRQLRERIDGEALYRFWHGLSYATYYVMFLLMGATITLQMFTDRWLAMLIAIAAAIVSRAAVIYGVMLPVSRLHNSFATTSGERRMLFIGGTRGAITIALALLIPIEQPWWYTVQSMAYGVVIFSIFVQLPWLRYVALPARETERSQRAATD